VVEPEGAGAADAPHLEVAGVLRRGDAFGIGAGRRRPARRGGLIVEGFMRPELVVGPPEGIEDALLGVQSRGGRSGCARLEGLVQAFVSAILLGAAGRDALVGDAKL
jgi:hypothetical protein